MPLPTNDPVAFRGVPSLGGNKKMAITMTFTQKQVEAMFQRHDALRAQGSSQCPLEIDFEDNRIYIGEIATPFARVKEDGTREICQRSPTVSKPLAGITLAGNVIGKLNIQRDFDQDVADNIRKLTEAEVSKRKERHIVRLDSPPVINKSKKSKPGSSASALAKTAMTNRAASNHAPASALSTSRPATPKASPSTARPVPPNTSVRQSVSGSSTPQTTVNSSTHADPDLTSLRSHMIHYLAFDPQTTQDVLLKIGGPNPSAESMREIEEILITVAEEVRRPKNAAPGPVTWRLRSRAWEELRPYQYGTLSDDDRRKLARKARLALGGIVDSHDPLWEHIRSDIDGSVSLTTKGKDNAKVVTSRPTIKTSDFKGGMFPKEKKSATKGGGVANGGVTKKKATTTKSKGKKEQEVEVEVEAKARKLVAGLDDIKGKAKAGPNSSTSSSAMPPNKTRLKEEEGVEDDAIPLSTKSRQSLGTSKKDSSTPPLKANRLQDEKTATKRKVVDAKEEDDLEVEEGELPAKPVKKRKVTEEVIKPKPKPKLIVNNGGHKKASKEKEQVSVIEEGTSFKTARDRVVIPRPNHPASSSKAIGPTGSKAPRLEKEKERERQEREALELERLKDREREKRRSGGKRARRATPSFSSDEDEVESKPPAPPRSVKPKPIQTSATKPAVSTSKAIRAPSPALPTDKEGLRRCYHTCYARYMGVTSKFYEQRAKIEEALQLVDGDSASADDMDMLDTEQLMQLRGEHERLREELERIRRAHAAVF